MLLGSESANERCGRIRRRRRPLSAANGMATARTVAVCSLRTDSDEALGPHCLCKHVVRAIGRAVTRPRVPLKVLHAEFGWDSRYAMRPFGNKRIEFTSVG